MHPEDFDEDDAETLENIRRKLSEFEEFVVTRQEAIKDRLEQAGTTVVTCSSCEQDAAILDDGIQCLFCGFRQSPEEGADKFISDVLGISYHATLDGLEWPLYWCPECRRETLVDRGPSGSQYPHKQFICFGCGAAWMEGELRYCGSCGQIYNPREDDFGMCDDCFSAIVNKD
jgi:hypothetical protein